MIQSKKVLRFFAPYLTSKGTIAHKGFGSKMAAARFLARQMVFDKVFGPKVMHSDYSEYGVDWWARDVPASKEGRAELWAKQYPLEECEGGSLDHWGHEHDCSFGCEAAGYARCRVHRDMQDIANGIYHGRINTKEPIE